MAATRQLTSMVLVIFGRKMRADANLDEYRQHHDRMDEIVRQIPGFIDIKGYRADDGQELAIVRFESLEALDAWRNHPEHVTTQREARKSFYESYWVQVCPTIRDYEWQLDTGRVEHPPAVPDVSGSAR